MLYIYVAGKYTGRTHDSESYYEIQANIDAAAEASRELARLGYGFFCPHLHSAHFEVIAPDIEPAFWYELDNHFLEACDAVLMLLGWSNSTGARAEKALAEHLGLPVFYSVKELMNALPPDEWSS